MATLIDVGEARRRLLEAATPRAAPDVPLDAALGRALAEDVAADRDFTATDRSAMDGFAVRTADLAVPGGTLRVAGELRGADMRSNVERCAYHRRVLEERLGQRIFIIELQGFLFFGTANSLLEQIRARGANTPQPNVHYILLDFRRVTGLDSSAVLSFVKGEHAG